MKRPLVLVVSDHRLVFDQIRCGFEPDFDVLTMVPHTESVIVAASVLDPLAVIVDLSRRSVRSAAMMTRLLEEVPNLPLVVLLDREANPDVKRQAWIERGLQRERWESELARSLERAFGGRVRAVYMETFNDSVTEALPETAYSLTFNC